MGATSEFLAPMRRRSDGKRDWPLELKAQIVAETLIEGERVKAVAKRHELIPSTVSDWRRMAHEGKLVLPNLQGISFVPVAVDEPREITAEASTLSTDKIELVKGDITIRLDGAIYVFRANRADRLKLVYWDGTGLVIDYKRLEGHVFKWPAVKTAFFALIGHNLKHFLRV